MTKRDRRATPSSEEYLRKTMPVLGQDAGESFLVGRDRPQKLKRTLPDDPLGIGGPKANFSFKIKVKKISIITISYKTTIQKSRRWRG